MLSGLTKVCFSYFLSICVHNQKLLYKHVTIAIQSLIPISLLTVTLRFDESFLSENSKTRNVDCWQRHCGKPMNRTLIFLMLMKSSVEKTKNERRNPLLVGAVSPPFSGSLPLSLSLSLACLPPTFRFSLPLSFSILQTRGHNE